MSHIHTVVAGAAIVVCRVATGAERVGMRGKVRAVVGFGVAVGAAVLRGHDTRLAGRLRHGERGPHGNGEGVDMVLGDLAQARHIDGITLSIGKHQ